MAAKKHTDSMPQAGQPDIECPERVRELVETFDRNADSYRSPGYNETQARREFIDPLFKELGWDVENEAGNAEAYKDVVHEDAIKVGGATEAPDYCFRIGGARKFFVEAKKPAANVAEDAKIAYQLRRYAWSAKLPLSILTDFEEFAVYDCRVKPALSDTATKARVLLIRYSDYVARWGEIASIFSKEAVLKGSFDKYAESAGRKKGTAEVDDAFLKEIEEWRDLLAHNVALRNPALTQRELNFSVGRIIDRIIFLRMCEDRGVEDYGRLQALLNGADVYGRLCELFTRADDRYNSGLFHFRPEKDRAEPPDELTPGLTIDDKVIKQIIKSLYYPDSPYEFSVLPADILGQVYEQFLGKVIRLTPGHRAVVEDKPEVKKAGGVYYTPTYIVDYIVKNTVGKLLEGKTPRGVAGVGKGNHPLRVLDPACGSGSFLIGAYQYLLDWHRDWYVQHLVPLLKAGKKEGSPEVRKLLVPQDGQARRSLGVGGPVYEAAGGEWRLTTTERKRILLAQIFGVDIDAQAVEVTKLSLLLKVLEGENRETLDRQQRLFHERALPDLGSNVKCGNSLIGPDFWETGQQTKLIRDEEERYRINAFGWQAELPEVFKGNKPGFDAVIGNPPYLRMEQFKPIKAYLRKRYHSHDERSDLYVYFVEQGHNLLADSGHFGMIVSNKFIRANYGTRLRDYLADHATMRQIVDFAGLPVFQKATVRTVVLITSKGPQPAIAVNYVAPMDQDRFRTLVSPGAKLEDVVAGLGIEISQKRLARNRWDLRGASETLLYDKVQLLGVPLAQYAEGRIFMGIKSGLVEAFVINAGRRRELLAQDPDCGHTIKPFLQGRDIRRYRIEARDEYLIYTFHGIDISRYPGLTEHLRPFRSKLLRRATKQAWYELQQPQLNFAEYLSGPKIVFPDMATTCRFAFDETGFFVANTVYFVPKTDVYLLGLLNSRLSQFYFRSTCAALEGPGDTYLRFFGQYLEGFPVRVVDETDRAEKAWHDRMIGLVQQMLSLQKELAGAKTPHEKEVLQRQIEATDLQIDRLVYELYGLSAEEIAIVEKATQHQPRR